MTVEVFNPDPSADPVRVRCYDCFRPQRFCFCSTIPHIRNQTEVLILQHVKERFHAFNTARIVRKALHRCQLLVRQTSELAGLPLPDDGSTGILYPTKDARLLNELPPSEQPARLVVLDGTWHHAKTLMKQIPALQQLPRYRLAPESPSEYRIRREPTRESLSTVEAVVAALRALEPETDGLDRLLCSFRKMVDDQLQHPVRAARVRKRKPGRPVSINIPSTLLQNFNRVVVVYGESIRKEALTGPCDGSLKAPPGPVPALVSVVAVRPESGECFEQFLKLPGLPSQTIRQHMGLQADDFRHGMDGCDFAQQWNQFVRADDVICAFNHSTLNRLQQLVGPVRSPITLKSVNCGVSYRTLDDLVESLNLPVQALPVRGRAAKRLASAAAYVRYLHSCRQ